MSLTKTEICQHALEHIGSKVTLTDVDSDTSAEAIRCKSVYDFARDSLLRSHVWKFALVWADLIRDAAAVTGTSSGSNGTTTLADTTKTWTLNQWYNYYVWITGGTGSGQIRLIASNTTSEVLTVTQAWTTTPDETSTYEIWQYAPPTPWAYQYILPSDFMRLDSVDPSDADFEIEGTRLKCDEDSLYVSYVRKVTDVTLFDAMFADVLALKVATRIVMSLLRDKVLYRDLLAELGSALKVARAVSRSEGFGSYDRPQTWNEARLG